MNAAIYHAVEDDQPETLRSLLDSGGDVNELYQDYSLISSKSILHMCCEKGRVECVRVLLERGADLTIQDPWYQTPLMYCMLTQYDDIAEMLLAHDPDIVDIGDKYGKTALHIAVDVGSIACIKLLFRYGAFVDVINHFGVTPLMIACASKDQPPETVTSVVRLLLEQGADVTLKDYRNRRTALQNAITIKNVEVVEMLLAAGSDPSTLDCSGRCPITNLLWYHHGLDGRGQVDDDTMLIIIMLVQKGADLNYSTHEHTNPLCMATLYCCTLLVEFLLSGGADQNVTFYCGVTPLHIATRNQDLNTAKVLLQWKSDLYRKGRVKRINMDYNTDAFHLAMDIGAFDIAMLLADVGYNVSSVKYLVDLSLTPPDSLLRSPDMLDWFRQYAVTVPSLFQMVVLAIRGQLRGNIAEKASLLQLPKILIQAVKMADRLT